MIPVIGFYPDDNNRGNERSRRTAGSKLGWLIVGRLFTAVLLFVVGLIWNRGGSLPGNSLVLLSTVAAFTIIYAAIWRLSRNTLLQAKFQLAVDVLLVTWLVWESDVIQSPYVALYIVVIAASSLFLSARDAVVTSVGCAVAFTACALVLLGAGEGRSATVSQAIQTVGLFDVAFLVVGLLSARLAERQSRSDVRLLAATQSLANLRELHERIVESIRSGVVTTDLEGRIYTFNLAAEEITGYQEESVRGKDASIFFGEMRKHFPASIRALETGEASPRFETDCLTHEGLRLRLGFSMSPLFSEANETTGMVITFQDLTAGACFGRDLPSSGSPRRNWQNGRLHCSRNQKSSRRNAWVNTDVARGSGQQFVASRVDGNHPARI
jgi:two-component system sensor histidine kinase PilS (NtrC family)